MRPAELYLPYVCETFRAERQGRREAWGNEEGTTRCATCGHVGLRVVAPAAVADSSVARFKTDGYALADFGNCPMFRNRLPGLFAPTRSSRSFGRP